MPDMPATLPLKNNNNAADKPIRQPPISAEYGVKFSIVFNRLVNCREFHRHLCRE